jgi:hypothetical protein
MTKERLQRLIELTYDYAADQERYADCDKVDELTALQTEFEAWKPGRERQSLFQRGEFILRSGTVSDYKIECEALTPSDWDALAHIIKARIPAFGAVYGVPRGGVPLQEVLAPFATGNELDPLLICDDVYTSGASIREAAKLVQWKGPVMGVVVFAREPMVEPWVQAVFGMLLEMNSRVSLYAEVTRLRAREAQLLQRMSELGLVVT